LFDDEGVFRGWDRPAIIANAPTPRAALGFWSKPYLEARLAREFSFTTVGREGHGGYTSNNNEDDSVFDFYAVDPHLPLAGIGGAENPSGVRVKSTLAGMTTDRPFFAKLSPEHLTDELWDDLEGISDFHDLDLWIGSRNWRTHTHYDFQHNMYVQLVGQKEFVLSPLREGDLFPHTHPRYRQTQSLVLDTDGMYSATLNEGDVLYIPPLWLHTVTTRSDFSASLAVCSRSLEEEIADKIELIGIPVSTAWEQSRLLSALRVYFKAIGEGAFAEVKSRFVKVYGYSEGKDCDLLETSTETLTSTESIVKRATAIKSALDEIESEINRRIVAANYMENVLTYFVDGRSSLSFWSCV
jgi:hypothetical protein